MRNLTRIERARNSLVNMEMHGKGILMMSGSWPDLNLHCGPITFYVMASHGSDVSGEFFGPDMQIWRYCHLRDGMAEVWRVPDTSRYWGGKLIASFKTSDNAIFHRYFDLPWNSPPPEKLIAENVKAINRERAKRREPLITDYGILKFSRDSYAELWTDDPADAVTNRAPFISKRDMGIEINGIYYLSYLRYAPIQAILVNGKWLSCSTRIPMSFVQDRCEWIYIRTSNIWEDLLFELAKGRSIEPEKLAAIDHIMRD